MLARGEAMATDNTTNRYHQPGDQWLPSWDFTGVAQDAELLHRLGLRLANSREWPNWGPASEFRAARDASAAERGASSSPSAPPRTMPTVSPPPPSKGERG